MIADYELAWPREIFARELRSIGSRTKDSRWHSRVKFVLEEAFVGIQPTEDFEALSSSEPLRISNKPREEEHVFVEDLLNNAISLREKHRPKPYWIAQRSGSSKSQQSRPDSLYVEFRRIIEDFHKKGYLEQVFPTECVDDHDPVYVLEEEVIADRIGISGLWPLDCSAWDEEIFYSLIEVFHDLVSRPRDRHYHDFSGCGWHYYGFSPEAAKMLYRWQVNDLLSRHESNLRVAKSGEDVGRMVYVVDEGRSELVERALKTEEASAQQTTQHAIALFRSKSSGTEEKRSAIVALAGVLEQRKTLVQDSLTRKDSVALFEVANKFDLRHRKADQHSDYDPVFLDWIFWWYLSTLELTNRLLGGRGSN